MKRSVRVLFEPLLVVAAYGVVSFAFTAASRDGGLLTPESVPDVTVAVVGLCAVVLRLLVLFVPVPVLVMRALTAVWPGAKGG